MIFTIAPRRFALLALTFTLWSSPFARAEETKTYNFEVNAIIGKNLPQRIDGIPNTLTVVGAKLAYPIPSGAIETSALYQFEGMDKAYTATLGYRYETEFEKIGILFDAGLHYSHFDLTVDYTSTGACDPQNCHTDSGYELGAYLGGGLQLIAGSNVPVRFLMQFHKNPKVWLLLSTEVGYRF